MMSISIDAGLEQGANILDFLRELGVVVTTDGMNLRLVPGRTTDLGELATQIQAFEPYMVMVLTGACPDQAIPARWDEEGDER